MPVMQLIGKGISRWVYDLGDGRVLKRCIPNNCSGVPLRYCDCRLEHATWCKTQAAFLAPIFDAGPHWVIMPKASKIGRDLPPRKVWDILTTLYTQAAELGITDAHPGNVGLFGDDWKIIDYSS